MATVRHDRRVQAFTQLTYDVGRVNEAPCESQHEHRNKDVRLSLYLICQVMWKIGTSFPASGVGTMMSLSL